jgi:hypothetical protein
MPSGPLPTEYVLPTVSLFWTHSEHSLPARMEKCIESILHHHHVARIVVYASYIEGNRPLTRLMAKYPWQVTVELIEVQYVNFSS